MQTSRPNEAGDTLAEIVIAIVIIGIIAGSFFAAIATTATASKSQRDLVTADAALRDYTESIKADARRDCPNSSTFTTTTIPGVVVTSNTNQCPVDTTSVQQVDLTAHLPNGTLKHLSIDVRTP